MTGKLGYTLAVIQLFGGTYIVMHSWGEGLLPDTEWIALFMTGIGLGGAISGGALLLYLVTRSRLAFALYNAGYAAAACVFWVGATSDLVVNGYEFDILIVSMAAFFSMILFSYRSYIGEHDPSDRANSSRL